MRWPEHGQSTGHLCLSVCLGSIYFSISAAATYFLWTPASEGFYSGFLYSCSLLNCVFRNPAGFKEGFAPRKEDSKYWDPQSQRTATFEKFYLDWKGLAVGSASNYCWTCGFWTSKILARYRRYHWTGCLLSKDHHLSSNSFDPFLPKCQYVCFFESKGMDLVSRCGTMAG